MLIWIIVIDAALLIWGFRKIKGKRRLLKWLLYTILIGWSTYLHVCNIIGVPHISLSTPYLNVFQPLGRAIIRWLGG
ncbi:hypothetical protein [Paenibacillus senegalimassiliensis]|uniref:hypothetical protein n=1 Tax=Paenibacillus senegalimassiliensis TaxID=1737426 RepID=UPI00073F9332|nr:hypothetical protein [Paenibacillus senegalimassiliensis]